MELLGVVAVRVDAGIGSERHLHAGLEGFPEVLALGTSDAALFFYELFGDAEVFRFSEDVVVVVDVHNKVGAVLFGEANPFVVHQRGVLDGVDAGADRIPDALGTMGMGGDLTSRGVRCFGSHLQFFVCVLRSARLIAFGEHSPRGEDFDDINSVFRSSTDDVLNLVGAVGDLEVTLRGEHGDAGLRGVVVQVAVSAGDGDAGAGGDDARSGDELLVDAVAQIHCEERK